MRTMPLLTPARTRAGYVVQVLGLAGLMTLCSFGTEAIQAAGLDTLVLRLEPGIALAGLLLLGMRLWPGVFLGFLALAFQGNDYGPTVWLALDIGAGLTILVTAWLFRRFTRARVDFDRLGGVLGYLALAAVLMPLVNLLAVHGALTINGLPIQMSGAWLYIYFFGWMISAVIIAPVLLAWLGPPSAVPVSAGWLERLGMAAGIGLVLALSREVAPIYFVPVFPLVAWAALRAGTRGATLMTLTIFAVTAAATAAGTGRSSENELRLFFSGLNLTLGVSGLLLSATVAEQRRSHRIERELKEAYQALIAAAPFGVVGLDRAGRVSIWSAAAERMFGWRTGEVLGAPQPIVPPGLADAHETLIPDPPEPVSAVETVRVRKDGSSLDVSLTAWPLYDADGALAGAMGVHQDITERKRAERLRRAIYRIAQAALTVPGEELYAAIHAIVNELMPARNLYIGLYDPDTDLLTFPYWSDQQDPRPAPRGRRRSLEDYVIRTGRPLRDLPAVLRLLEERGEVDPAGSSSADWIGVPLQVGERTIGVLAVASRDPAVRYTEQEQAILEFVSSQVAMAIERKRAEEAVRHSEERFRVVATTTNDVVWEWDVLRDVDWWSDNLRQILGYDPAEVQAGQPLEWDGLVHPADRERVVGGLRAAVAGTGDLWRDEYRIRRRDGSYAYVFDRARILRDPDGAAIRVLGAMMDITERREAEEALRRSEEQLRQAMKMEAVGRLAGGVAHDFNNLLTSVLGHADLALNALEPTDSLHDDLLQIKAAGTRAAALTQQLLAFSRKQVLEPRVVDINAVVTSLARMLRRTIGEDIELVTRLSAGIGVVRADPVQLEQVLLNLAVNARDAMPAGGRLTIETSSVRLAGGAVVRVRVEDTGVGMSDEVRAHLFEPFFTTKEVGKGTGLGLATAYGIVQQSGGTITVHSSPGRGSTFVIDLPQVRGEPTPAEREPVVVRAAGTETILLVEDEESVRNLTRRVLEQYGYQVLSAPSGEAALELSRLHRGTLHLLLTDVVMPGISGPRLAEILLAERPDMRLIFMSGYAATTLEQRILLDPESAFLQKPFSTEQLIRRIRETLDAVQA